MMRLGVFDNPPGSAQILAQQDGAIARQIAESGMVLLRNDSGMLPFDASKLKTISVIGAGAGRPGSRAGAAGIDAAYRDKNVDVSLSPATYLFISFWSFQGDIFRDTGFLAQ
jgi:beta-glucosidase